MDTAIEQEKSRLWPSTIIDLNNLIKYPNNYDFFAFKPNVKKLILSGQPDAQHISILWYTHPSGTVDLHYHAMTEAVYIIDGKQSDKNGTSSTGMVSFNPPGSGHRLFDSTGFFLLVYAAPPDFTNSHLIQAYTPIKIDTHAFNLASFCDFSACEGGVSSYDIPLDPTGGLSAKLLKITSPKPSSIKSSCLLMLDGFCHINHVKIRKNNLVISPLAQPITYHINGETDSPCLLLSLSFLSN